jgi:hypothetical protein
VIPEDIAWGLRQLAFRRPAYELHDAYYDGNHRLAFATKRVRDAFGTLFSAFSLNLCATVVDTLCDRLQVVGFSAPGAEAEAPDVQAVWEANRMPARHGRVHRDALALGDAYLQVWQDREGAVRIYDESPYEVVGRPDPDRPGELAYAVKAWRQDKRVRVTVYYRDRVERYITVRETDMLPKDPWRDLRGLAPEDVEPGADGRDEVPNPWQVVPIFHFANRPGHSGLGVSELRDIVPPQDALNKTVADLLATSESHALPLRYLIGVEPETDEATGQPKPIFQEDRNRAVVLPKGSEAGQWPAGDLGGLLAVKADFAADVSRVSGTPLHLLMGVQGSDWPAGVALRTAESRLVSKADDRVREWGPTWADAMRLAARMRQTDPGQVRSLWAPTVSPVSDEEAARAAELKLRAGIPRTQVWREMGYSEAQIADMERAYQTEQAAQAEALARQFAAGDPAATGGL